IAAPPIALAWYTRLDMRNTFSLRMPTPLHLLAALLLAVSASPISKLIFEFQAHFTGTSKVSLAPFEQLARMLTQGNVVSVVMAAAIVPAICEEILFRGLLTSGLRGSMSLGRTVLVVGVLFGLYHVLVEKMAITIILGMVLTYVCLRSGSIFA